MKEYFNILNKFPNLEGTVEDPIKIIKDEIAIQEWQSERRDKLVNTSKNPEWADIGIICNDPYVTILRDLVEFPGGYRGGYIRLYNRAYLEGGAAGVVTMPVKDGEILLMHNFRHATRSWHWEIPRGFGEPGVSAENQARAEIKEEIGVDATELVDLGTLYNNTGLEGNPVCLFLARIAGDAVINIEIGVDQLLWVSIQELEDMIAKAEITDGFTIAAYTRAKLQKLI